MTDLLAPREPERLISPEEYGRLLRSVTEIHADVMALAAFVFAQAALIAALPVERQAEYDQQLDQRTRDWLTQYTVRGMS